MLKVIRLFASTVLLVVVAILISFSANAQQVPKELQPPADTQLLLRVHAKGDGTQFTWTLKAPEAQLEDMNGKRFGKHFAGPSWEANDGSRIVGKAAANAPSPNGDSIPWLLLTVVSHEGEGVLARVSFVQRLNTRAGKQPASVCDAAHVGQEEGVPYSADYAFFAPK